MAHVQTVNVFEAENKASEILSGKLFSESVSIDDEVKEFSAFCKLHY